MAKYHDVHAYDFFDCGELPPELPVIDIEEIQNT